MDIEAFVRWARHDTRKVEERYTVELVVEGVMHAWHIKYEPGRFPSVEEKMERDRQRRRNPAYEPSYSEEESRRGTESPHHPRQRPPRLQTPRRSRGRPVPRDQRTPGVRLRPKIRAFCVFCILAFAPFVLAADTANQPLDAAIARALKPVPIQAEYDDAADQRNAVTALRDWPQVSAAEEAMIAAALQQLRTAPEANLSHAAIMALGRRGHRELIPEYFARIETEPDELRTLFFLMPDRENDPPIELLRTGLTSHNPRARVVTLDLVEWCKARNLRPEMERLLIGDPNEAVRIQAATTLWLLECRESIPMLCSALRGSENARRSIGWALANLGGDAEVEVLAPLLSSKSAETRELIAKGFGRLQLSDPKAAIEVLRPLLDDKERKVRIATAITLGAMKDSHAVPAIQTLLKSRNPPSDQDRDDIIRALGAVGDDAAVAVLNQLSLNDHAVQKELLRLAHPSSGYAVWDACLCDPIMPNPGSDVPVKGNFNALRLLEKLADQEIFRAIRLRAGKLRQDSLEKRALDELAVKLAARFPIVAAEPLDTLQSEAPDKPSDRDKDGVPDRHDKYPDDNRRSEDIPKAHFESPVQVPAKFYGVISLADEGPASKNILFMAIDDDHRTGWLTKASDLDPPDYHVATSNVSELDEWPLPNPGDTPGVYRLDPSSVNAEGTVVGTAVRRKVAIPLRQNIHEAHITFQSGFVFEQGRLRFDPPAPFTGRALNVSYKRVNNRGVIFGHREVKMREGDNDVFRTFAFVGDHLFREVPVFDVTAMTDAAQLLCFRFADVKQESFVWDGAVFHDLGSLAGKPDAVRAYALNQKLQVVGLSDALDKDRCPTGFFWESGKMRAFSELIPEDFRPHLRSAIPYLISDSGSINFRAEEKAGPFPQFWPKRDFLLQLGADGNKHISVQYFGGGAKEEE